MPNDKSLQLRVDAAFLRRLDRYRQQQPFPPPSRPQAIRDMCDKLMPPDSAVVTKPKRKAGRNA